MTNYRIFQTDGFQKDFRKLSRSGLERIQHKLLQYVYPQLHAEPHFGLNIKRLRIWDPPAWRYRIASWRFFYEIDENDKIIYMTVADHRSATYDD